MCNVMYIEPNITDKDDEEGEWTTHSRLYMFEP